MRRTLTWTLLLLVFTLVGVVSTVLLRAEPASLAAPDPATVIQLPDGSRRPLAEVLERARQGEDFGWSPPVIRLAPPLAAEVAPDPERQRVAEDVARAVQSAIREHEGTVFHLAEVARHEGRLDEAAALYLSIPEDDRRYGRAQRRLAWDVLTKGQGQPRRAVAFAHAALAAEPFDANSWQDLARVYGATLGLDVDEWD